MPSGNDSRMRICNRVLQIIEEYQNSVDKCYKDACSNVAYQQYARGGEFLHRGYYCPSLIADIITGKANRGKIVKHIVASKDYTYKFSFDPMDNLILVEQTDVFEVVFHKGRYEIGITAFKEDMKIQSVSECEYKDGQLFSYVLSLYDPYNACVVEIVEEKYTYLNDQVKVIRSYFILSMGDWLKQSEEYTFTVENGYLTSYSLQEVDVSNSCKKKDARQFKVKTNRKI